jgi:hypothetical protein
MVLPEQVTVSRAFEAFNDDGSLVDGKKLEAVQSLCRRLVEVAGRLA